MSDKSSKHYWQAFNETEVAMKRIEQGLEKRYGKPTPPQPGWGMVGELNYLNKQLKELADRINHEGEYATTI